MAGGCIQPRGDLFQKEGRLSVLVKLSQIIHPDRAGVSRLCLQALKSFPLIFPRPRLPELFRQPRCLRRQVSGFRLKPDRDKAP